MSAASSFLGLEGLHVFITGAAGGIGSCAVGEFLGKSGGRRSLIQPYLSPRAV